MDRHLGDLDNPVYRQNADGTWQDNVHQVADIASKLDAAGIDHVLWGDYLSAALDQRSNFAGSLVEFVVPDDQLEKAMSTLLAVEGSILFDPHEASVNAGRDPFDGTPLPPQHPDYAGYVRVGPRGREVSFYKQSDLLWNLESLKVTGNGDIVYASIEERHQEWFPQHPYDGPRISMAPARVVSEHQLTAALALLYCRDKCRPDCLYYKCWQEWLREIDDPDRRESRGRGPDLSPLGDGDPYFSDLLDMLRRRKLTVTQMCLRFRKALLDTDPALTERDRQAYARHNLPFDFDEADLVLQDQRRFEAGLIRLLDAIVLARRDGR